MFEDFKNAAKTVTFAHLMYILTYIFVLIIAIQLGLTVKQLAVFHITTYILNIITDLSNAEIIRNLRKKIE